MQNAPLLLRAFPAARVLLGAGHPVVGVPDFAFLAHLLRGGPLRAVGLAARGAPALLLLVWQAEVCLLQAAVLALPVLGGLEDGGLGRGGGGGGGGGQLLGRPVDGSARGRVCSHGGQRRRVGVRHRCGTPSNSCGPITADRLCRPLARSQATARATGTGGRNLFASSSVRNCGWELAVGCTALRVSKRTRRRRAVTIAENRSVITAAFR